MSLTAADLAPIQAEYPTLNAFGFQETPADSRDAPRPEIVQKCMEWLLRNDGLERRKTINTKLSSYWWKHVVEREIEEYVANGEFIFAALYLGYKIKTEAGGPNAWFNIRNPKQE